MTEQQITDEFKPHLDQVKKMIRQILVTNWNSFEQIEAQLPPLNAMNRIPKLKQELDTIKEGIKTYKKNLDETIAIFS